MKPKIYLAGPSAELFITEPGESRIEQIFELFREKGIEPIHDWPKIIRQFHSRDWKSAEDKRRTLPQEMRKDYAKIVEADLICFALTEQGFSRGMLNEEGVAEFIGKPCAYLFDVDTEGIKWDHEFQSLLGDKVTVQSLDDPLWYIHLQAFHRRVTS